MPSPRMSFPDPDKPYGCGEWCRPIHMVEAAIAGQPFGKYFAVDDFMVMGRLHRRPRPDIILYKHRHTRRYLNLDDAAHAYRYLPPPLDSTRLGQYRPHADLVAAIDDLHLDEMPWLFGTGFASERLGLSSDERWKHPDVAARFARQWERDDRRRRRRATR